MQREEQAHSPTKSDGDSAVLKGLVWRKAWCAFKRVVGMAVFGATGGNPFGSRPNFFGRQHLTFDKGGKDIVLFVG